MLFRSDFERGGQLRPVPPADDLGHSTPNGGGNWFGLGTAGLSRGGSAGRLLQQRLERLRRGSGTVIANFAKRNFGHPFLCRGTDRVREDEVVQLFGQLTLCADFNTGWLDLVGTVVPRARTVIRAGAGDRELPLRIAGSISSPEALPIAPPGDMPAADLRKIGRAHV